MADKAQNFVLRWQLTLVFLIMMTALIITLLYLQASDSRINKNQEAIVVVSYQQCLNLNKTQAGTNAVLDVLIEATQRTDLLSKEEKTRRLIEYEAVKEDLQVCTVPNFDK